MNVTLIDTEKLENRLKILEQKISHLEKKEQKQRTVREIMNNWNAGEEDILRNKFNETNPQCITMGMGIQRKTFETDPPYSSNSTKEEQLFDEWVKLQKSQK